MFNKKGFAILKLEPRKVCDHRLCAGAVPWSQDVLSPLLFVVVTSSPCNQLGYGLRQDVGQVIRLWTRQVLFGA